MTIIIGILIFATICFCSVQIILGITYRKSKRQFATLLKAEQTKSYFAIARNEMMRMALENKIDANTDMFKMVYGLNTVIMKRPDEYPAISRELTSLVLNINQISSKANHKFTQDERRILKFTADALSHIIIEYSSFLKFMFKAKKITNRGLSKTGFLGFLIQVGIKERQKMEVIKEIKVAKAELYLKSEYPEIPHWHEEPQMA